MNFDEFLKSISKVKNIPLPAEPSQFKMVPAFRQDMLRQQKSSVKQAKKAAVLALFYPDKTNETRFVLILRKTYKGVHSAQIGFPGGRVEFHDASLQDAALRETYEEVGVPIGYVEVLRQITNVYIPPSNFYVYPFLGVCRQTPKFERQEEEVEAILEVALKHFLDDTNVVTKKVRASYSAEVEVPAFELNNQIVWGATAMMLSEIKDLLKQLL